MLNEEQGPPAGPVHCEASSPVKKKARAKRLAIQSGCPTASFPKIAGQSQLATQPAGSVMTCSGSSSSGAWTAIWATSGRCSITLCLPDSGERPGAQTQRPQDPDSAAHPPPQHLPVLASVT